MKTLALILAGGRGTRLDILSDHRAKPSVPFAGKYRIIDFTLSNCVNSEIYNIGILTQYLPMSLNNHIGIGKPWDLDRRIGGATLLQPYTGKEGGWYEGTAHAVSRNINFIKNQNPDYVIILSGDHVYKMNYNKLISYHEEKQADLTIAAQRVPIEEANRFGILEPDTEMKIIDFQEKPDNPPSNLASMGIYVFSTDVLISKLKEYCSRECSDFGHHIIPKIIEQDDAYLYEFEGYWKDVGTLESFWETNLGLLNSNENINLYDENWKIHTRSEGKPPVKFGKNGLAINSLVSNGSIVKGEVKNSVISPGVVVEEGTVVKDSIIFNDTVIKKNAIIDQAIIDKNVTVGEKSQIGFGDDLTSNFEKPELLNNGLNVIAKGAKIPSGVRIGRNCRVVSYVKKSDFNSKNVASGSTIRPRY
ncbi:glucose-1-phosphate adenylyltransferase [Natroniella sulfidigena]|uniref:glucose-1-phosphate adenylyltransferase n=1 Tax=Natroniella sulfidigena TaxID=723921 RepID=UPI00200A0896|nr:glucose-1-phosphate adenylyltransferase [Natroniella sulfidigena]MCK8817320.1 glucose-1-phosphate adenylyltransferase [Natroniella sulfidigena]